MNLPSCTKINGPCDVSSAMDMNHTIQMRQKELAIVTATERNTEQ